MKFVLNKFIIFWFPVLIWAGFIFFLSSIPNLKTDLEQDFILRKIAHMLEYAILCFLLIRAFAKEKLTNKKIAIYSIVFAIFYAFTDEYHQTFIQGRQGSLKDAGIDSIGILIMAWLWYIRNKRIKGR